MRRPSPAAFAFALLVAATAAALAADSFNGNTPKSNPAGKPSLNCHHAGGGAPTFAAAGTVYEGLEPAASVEVRAIGANGKAWSAYTNADGNFLFPAATQPIAFPALQTLRAPFPRIRRRRAPSILRPAGARPSPASRVRTWSPIASIGAAGVGPRSVATFELPAATLTCLPCRRPTAIFDGG